MLSQLILYCSSFKAISAEAASQLAVSSRQPPSKNSTHVHVLVRCGFKFQTQKKRNPQSHADPYGDLAVLTLLDLSAAFDSVDHATLLQRLRISYGIVGSVIAWFSSYLSDRSQYVHLPASMSTESAVLYGVPQNSVLRPVLFLLYTADLLQLIRCHQLHPHVNADDTQIYGFCHPYEADALQLCLSACVNRMQYERLIVVMKYSLVVN